VGGAMNLEKRHVWIGLVVIILTFGAALIFHRENPAAHIRSSPADVGSSAPWTLAPG